MPFVVMFKTSDYSHFLHISRVVQITRRNVEGLHKYSAVDYKIPSMAYVNVIRIVRESSGADISAFATIRDLYFADWISSSIFFGFSTQTSIDEVSLLDQSL